MRQKVCSLILALCMSAHYALAEVATIRQAESGRRELAYTWTSTNTMSYMCASSMDLTAKNLACAQSEFGGTSQETPAATITCPGNGQIQCFVFAAIGKVGGSCAGDEFMEDPSGEWAHLPQAPATACLGSASCVLTQQSATAINGATLTFGGTGSAPALNKAKYLAVCNGTYIPVDTADTTDDACPEACTGTDDQGNACPPNLSSEGLCPPGCVQCGEASEDTDSNTETTTPSPSDADPTVPDGAERVQSPVVLSLSLISAALASSLGR